ncbi:hypothetical protein SAY87_030672 [Trapa incisa]|uniref:NAC domain-containing protein n=1 Tax=Trapa incisa TaxID=236973 RepID=A0AAN7KUM9_9MYRT|nr:hypothetical protein SAY87_030672 [Trapa incisa]
MKNPQSSLPPGFRFHPTDEELILHYLQKKVSSFPLPVSIIADVDIYKFDPWDLPAMAAFGEKEWYFFSPRDRKYPNGARPNRAAGSGYWKATGTDKIIMDSSSSVGSRNDNIGVKKALVFYKGRPPKGTKTSWIMHEYRITESPCTLNSISRPIRLKDSSMRLDDWVLCRIYKKTNALPASTGIPAVDQDQEEEEHLITPQDTKPPELTIFQNSDTSYNTLLPHKSSSFSNLLDAMDYAMLSSFMSDSSTEPNSLSFLDQSDPALNHALPLEDLAHHTLLSAACPTPAVENAFKRQRSGFETGEMFHPSKKLHGSTCSFSTGGATPFDVPGQHNSMFNHSLLNQQRLLSPNAQFLE